uniref:hypothetical protein n=1 Tax=Stappia sp. TaxID=1870903 RepID=UPI003BAB568B
MSDDDEGGDWFADAGAALAAQRPDQAERAKKRPRGRPKGSLNRKTQAFEEFYREKGYRDPLTAMAQFLTTDPVALQAWIIEHERAEVALGKKIRQACPSLFDIIREQHTVASQLSPYLHGKKPTELAIIDERLPMLVLDLGTNQLEEGTAIAGRKAMSLGELVEGENVNEINDGEADE